MSYVGVTILYYYKNGSINGVLKSYSLEYSDLSNLASLIEEQASKEISNFHPNYQFLGVNDVFKVSGKASDQQVMGRTSLYDVTTELEAKELVRKPKDYSSNEVSSTSYFNCSLVFFYSDEEEPEESFALTILILLKADSLQDAISKATILSEQEAFKQKIVDFSIDEILLENVRFIGFEDFCNIDDDIEEGGAYQTFYSEFESLQELEEETLTSSEFKELVEGIDLE